jgi:hypothetical protein
VREDQCSLRSRQEGREDLTSNESVASTIAGLEIFYSAFVFLSCLSVQLFGVRGFAPLLGLLVCLLEGHKRQRFHLHSIFTLPPFLSAPYSDSEPTTIRHDLFGRLSAADHS